MHETTLIDKALPIRATVELPAGAVRIEAPRPILVTQSNASTALGMKPRSFLELVREAERDGVAVVRHGKIRGLLVADLESWIRRRDHAARVSTDGARDDEAGVDSFLAELGEKRRGAR